MFPITVVHAFLVKQRNCRWKLLEKKRKKKKDQVETSLKRTCVFLNLVRSAIRRLYNLTIVIIFVRLVRSVYLFLSFSRVPIIRANERVFWTGLLNVFSCRAMIELRLVRIRITYLRAYMKPREPYRVGANFCSFYSVKCAKHGSRSS